MNQLLFMEIIYPSGTGRSFRNVINKIGIMPIMIDFLRKDHDKPLLYHGVLAEGKHKKITS